MIYLIPIHIHYICISYQLNKSIFIYSCHGCRGAAYFRLFWSPESMHRSYSTSCSPTFNIVWKGLLVAFFWSCSSMIFCRLKRRASHKSSTCMGSSTCPLLTCRTVLLLLLPLLLLLLQLVRILLVPLPVVTLRGQVLIPRSCLMSPRRCPLPITDSIPRLLLFSCSRSCISSCVSLFH